ncbi:MAG: DUF2167 domain-containing protein [Planctomycetales bacterium]|nr:DUF2167 domain-containing protein [Planctomycetales bacterium]
MRKIYTLLAILLAMAPVANAQELDSEQLDLLAKLNSRLKYETGTIVVGRNLATLSLPPTLRFLGPDSTKFVVEELWGNPPGGTYLGMIAPSDKEPFDEDFISAIITYEESGHISDDDASSIDYDELLATMKSGEQAENAERAKLGYESVRIVGWAQKPRYDGAGNKLYWAKELEFGGEPEHTLNYSIRALGRVGVLELNFVGTMNQLAEIDKMSPEVLKAVAFNPGNRYADFDPSTDKVAGYGIAALVAGGVAAKAGLFKGIWLAILAFKKLIIVGVIGAGALIAKLLGGGKSTAK